VGGDRLAPDEVKARFPPPAWTGACPVGAVLMPGGPFTLGMPESEWQAAGIQPKDRIVPTKARTVTLEPWCMDAFEFPNLSGEPPMVSVSWAEATSICGDQGKRLCTEDEWEAACRGTDGWAHPYGPTHEPGRCHDGIGSQEDTSNDVFHAVGTVSRCVTPTGIYDLDGNVSEWVDRVWNEPVDPTRSTPNVPQGTVQHVLRGGTAWPAFYGQDCHSRHPHPSGFDRGGDDGFRCCADPR
jgi:eukaryotic-like serine/threonine-protein kinase